MNEKNNNIYDVIAFLNYFKIKFIIEQFDPDSLSLMLISSQKIIEIRFKENDEIRINSYTINHNEMTLDILLDELSKEKEDNDER